MERNVRKNAIFLVVLVVVIAFSALMAHLIDFLRFHKGQGNQVCQGIFIAHHIGGICKPSANI